jgi:hypothetical protein
MTRTALSAALSAAVCLGHIPPAVAQQPPPQEELVGRVGKAIDKGVQFLKDQEAGKGHWEVNWDGATLMPGGWSSMAMIALLTAGVKPDDPVVERGLKYLREMELRDTYVVGLQTMVFSEVYLRSSNARDLERIQKNVDWILAARVRGGDGTLRGWGYGLRGGGADNSNSQYALLGLHAGKQAGAKIDETVWKEIRDYYLSTQTPDGGWRYHNEQSNFSPILTMTVAGLCGLYIAGMELSVGQQGLQVDGKATACGFYKENPQLAKAHAWIDAHFDLRHRPHQFYSIYGLERAGRLSGRRFLGEHDWYRDGCKYLVELQKDDGSWSIRNQGTDGWPVVSTSFALLFLSKGRTPVLISKLAYGQGDGWNNKHYDAKNLVEYASRELFKKQPMAWQVFDARKLDLPNDAAINEQVANLLQSPIVYMNGHNAPRLTAVEKNILRKYISEGGFLLAEACCGSENFTQGFRSLMMELFPDIEMKPLKADHAIWQAFAKVPPDFAPLEGIDMGCKTVVVFSPQPLAGWWEEAHFAPQAGQKTPDRAGERMKYNGFESYRLAGNIIAYATGMDPPKPRLTKVEIASNADEKVVPRSYLKMAQIKPTGEFRSASRGLHNLMDHLAKAARLDVKLQSDEVTPGNDSLFSFRLMYLHGRNDFRMDPEDYDNIRSNLQTGGILLADACCGRKEFDVAFRKFAAELFPKNMLELIPLTDELYSKELNPEPIRTVRCRREKADGSGPEAEFRDMPPHLEGIKIDGRWVVVYSKYDLGCALEKSKSTDCMGHDYDSALKLAGAVVLYALKK